jgi:hypothetical protein
LPTLGRKREKRTDLVLVWMLKKQFQLTCDFSSIRASKQGSFRQDTVLQ